MNLERIQVRHLSDGTVASNRQSTFDQHLYVEYVKRIKNVKPKMDNKPGMLNVAGVMRLGNVLADIEGFNKIHNYNFKLLRSLNEIKHVFLDKNNKWEGSGLNAADLSTLSSPSFRYNALKLEKENKKFQSRLEEIRNRNQATDSKLRSKALKCQIGKFKLPEKILAKYYGKVQLPPDPCLQFKLLRPSIFIDLEAKNERPIGCVTFQLYTEACPMIVLELVKIFIKKQNAKLKFSRVYPNLWAECEVAVDSKNFNLPSVEYDMRALDHGSSAGIISVDVRRQSLRYLRHGLLVLSISFKPVPILNGRRVAIGRITNGRRNLIGLSEYGTKNGKPLKNIVVTQLGIVDN